MLSGAGAAACWLKFIAPRCGIAGARRLKKGRPAGCWLYGRGRVPGAEAICRRPNACGPAGRWLNGWPPPVDALGNRRKIMSGWNDGGCCNARPDACNHCALSSSGCCGPCSCKRCLLFGCHIGRSAALRLAGWNARCLAGRLFVTWVACQEANPNHQVIARSRAPNCLPAWSRFECAKRRVKPLFQQARAFCRASAKESSALETWRFSRCAGFAGLAGVTALAGTENANLPWARTASSCTPGNALE